MTAVLEQDVSVAQSSGAGTTISATLPSTATSGRLIITAISLRNGDTAVTAPSGFSTAVILGNSTNTIIAVSYKISDGTESVITWTRPAFTQGDIWVGEYSGLDGSSPDVSIVTNASSGAVTSNSTGTTSTTTQADTLAIAFMAAQQFANVQNTRAWTNSFSEVPASFPTASNSPGLSVADKIIGSVGTVESTFSTTSTGDEMAGAMLVWKIAGAGDTIPVTQVTETNIAQAIAVGIGAVSLLVGQVTETDIAQPVTPLNALIVGVGQVVETNTAQSLTVLTSNNVPVTQVVENNTAQPVTVIQGNSIVVGQVIENNTAQPLAVDVGGVSIPVSQVSELNTAQAITVIGGNIITNFKAVLTTNNITAKLTTQTISARITTEVISAKLTR